MKNLYTVTAVNYVHKEFRREFNTLESAQEFFNRLTSKRESIALYKSLTLIVDHHPLVEWLGAVSYSQALGFYRDCVPFWHDGIISAEAIAIQLNCPIGRVELYLNACLAWKLPVSKANGLWAF